jgi:hypothetical protein
LAKTINTSLRVNIWLAKTINTSLRVNIWLAKTINTSLRVNIWLAKTINTSLRVNISESKFKEIKSKFKRPQNCQNLMIPTVNEVVWTKGIPNSMPYVLETLDY